MPIVRVMRGPERQACVEYLDRRARARLAELERQRAERVKRAERRERRR